MNYTFGELQEAWNMYLICKDGPEKEGLWARYCEIRDELEKQRVKIRPTKRILSRAENH